jgi:hypothetical protein
VTSTISGTGTLALTGGSDTLSGATLSASGGVIVSGSTVTLAGAITLTDTLVAASPQIIVAAGGATLSGGGRLELTNASTNTIVGASAAATLTNNDIIFGAGDLGDGNLTLDNGVKGIIEADDTVPLTINTGTTSTIVNAGEIIAVTALTIDSPVANTGVLYAVGGTLTAEGAVTGAGTVSASTSASGVNFTGTGNVFSGALEGAGAIYFTGGSDTLSGSTLSASGGVIVSGSTVTLAGAITLTDTLVAASPQIIVAAGGATLAGAGGRLELTNASTNTVVGASAAATLTNNDIIFGAGDLGDGKLTLDNGVKGIVEGDDSVPLTINTGSNAIINAGDIVAITAATIDSAVTNTGLLLADGGTLTAAGAVTGAGGAEVEGAGTLILKGAFNETVTFATGSTGTLELGDSKGYTTGSITGFSKTGTNSLDLLDIPFISGTTTATYSGTTTSGVLTVKDGANVATIHLTGNYTTSTFTVSASSAGGTKIVDPATVQSPHLIRPAPLSPHHFIAAMAGFGATNAGSGAISGDTSRPLPLALAIAREHIA